MQRYFQGITDFIFVEQKPERSDIIFVPGGNYPEAAQYAAKLYHQGYAPRILPSGRYSILKRKFEKSEADAAMPLPGEIRTTYETEWEYLRDILLRQGVPPEAILREEEATFTYENAIYSRRVTDRLGLSIQKGILCCQTFHARRCLMYYQEQFPETEFLVCPVETKGISRENWYKDPVKIDVVLSEVERCGSQFHEIMRGHVRGGKPDDRQ